MLSVKRSTAVSSSSSSKSPPSSAKRSSVTSSSFAPFASTRISGVKRKDAPTGTAVSFSSSIDSSISSRLTRAKLHHLVQHDSLEFMNSVAESMNRQKNEIAQLREQLEAAKASAASSPTTKAAFIGKLLTPVDPQTKLATIPLPPFWSSMAYGEKSKLVEIDRNTHFSEWKKVKDHFMLTLEHPHMQGMYVGVWVTKVERIQNPVVYRRYALRKQELTAIDPSQPVDIVTYHGCKTSTVADPISAIISDGLKTQYGVQMSGHIWLAACSGYSAGKYKTTLDATKNLYQVFLVKCAPHTNESQYQASFEVFTVSESDRMWPAYLVTFSTK